MECDCSFWWPFFYGMMALATPGLLLLAASLFFSNDGPTRGT